MKLKTLEISGFKSFADRTKIDFMPGITGVVGPNGSGKSNIIEAIRWVMGEQSAKGLRGDKMSDVIFGGTTKRAPLNRAQVTITFDNTDGYLKSDYSEIQITRTLYRNGDSKYQLNGTQVRLKDIHELFMDSGLGRESFSIISQGRVERIFSAKPEDRRKIIEDVAGVYKYKQNKEKAEKELTTVHDNLSRVQDILFELEQRVEPLAEQAAKAKDYQMTKAQYDQLDQSRVVLELTDWYAQQKNVTAAVLQAETVRQEQAKQVDEQVQRVADLKQVEHERQVQQQAAQEQLLALATQREQLLGEQKLQAERLANRSQAVQELSEQVTQQQATIAALQQTQAEREAEITKQQAHVATLKTALQTAQAEHPAQQVSQLTTEIEQMRTTVVETMQALTTAKNQQTYLAQEHERHDAQTARLATRHQTLQATIDELTQSVDQAAQAADEQAVALAAAQAELKRLQVQGKAQEIESQEKRQAWFDKMEQDQRLSTRLQSLQRLTENYDGYYQGVRNLMKAKANLTGIHGVVAELIDVAPTHRLAVETALGGALQNIIVADEQAAKQAIRYLQTHRLGRVTFLPLTTVKQRALQPQQVTQAQTQAGYIGIAADLVTVAPQYQAILRSLLATTIIVADIDAAVAMAKTLQHRVRLVTLDGQVMNAGGSMTGGANRNQDNGLLAQQAEIASLTEQVATLHRETETLEKTVQQLNQTLQTTTAAFNEQQQQVLVANETAQQAITAHQVLVERLQQAQREQQSLQYEVSLTDDGSESQTDIVAKNEALVLTLTAQQAEQQATLTTLIAEQTALQAAVVMANEAVAQRQADLAVAKNTFTSAQERLTDTIERLTAEQQQLTILQKQQADLVDPNRHPAADIASELAAVTTAKDETEILLAQLAEQLTTLAADLTFAEEQLQLTQSEQTDLLHDLNELSGQQGELKTAIHHNEQILVEQYDTSFEFAKLALAKLPLDEIQTQLKLLKQGLAEIGQVNLGAITEYDDVKERYDFLTQQRDDLLAAQDNLRETMSEMDEEVQVRFKETYDAVAQHFEKIFVKMFGGGQAALQLTNPADLLTTGVDIMAQPPGKKFQQMSLLSGGEKALTAISLLFAILEVRPVPFVVLDETEAALDEVNVTRFGRYLHDVNDHTQFIVITHRKGTMTSADVLYGVTMQEPGVSTMVSVNLATLADDNVEI